VEGETQINAEEKAFKENLDWNTCSKWNIISEVMWIKTFFFLMNQTWENN
jgi:hypothetical protein